MSTTTAPTRWNLDVMETQYAAWQADPSSVDPSWQQFFQGFELGYDASSRPSGEGAGAGAGAAVDGRKQARFTGAIYDYRSIGHTQAAFNPLDPEPAPNPRLSLQRLGFTEADLDEPTFETGNFLHDTRLTLRELIDRLQRTYCGNIGVEYLHIQETPQRRWIQSRLEPSCSTPDFDRTARLRILRNILEAETFEKFLHTRFVGQKRFSLEGGETLIAALDALIDRGPEHGIEEIIMGMAHRGRLNVLCNVLGKSFPFLFREFSENYVPDTTHGDGDVKYHLGYDAEIPTSSGKPIRVRLAANPSHLEAVNPVVEGRARARQRILGDFERKRVLPILIHGDAAFAGQGMVAEVLNLSKLKGYTTGGTIHYIINNQIGFTTNPSEARSSRYCTDVAKMIEAPVFHVNGDDPLSVVWVTLLAIEFRQAFGVDVVIDMYCYRRHGHNESDEPAFTQPLLYKKLARHPLVSETLGKRMIEAGDLTAADLDQLRAGFQQRLEDGLQEVRQAEPAKPAGRRDVFAGSTAVFQPRFSFAPARTAVSRDALTQVARCLTRVPEGFKPNPKIQRLLNNRTKVFDKDEGIDWGFAESLAWGTLLQEGHPVRLSGQDCERGTFSHRHAAVYDIETRARHLFLEHLENSKAWVCVHNSLLSEAAVLGFDYGYSLDFPQMLVLWEAQFGDFVNGAQVIIDQFLVSSESKWQRVSGLVLLLPHGYEGQGPEHSSARLERFLQSCAEDNIQVVNATTPAQYFHLLRRQVHREFCKPLVVMSPKSLLRHPAAVSKLADFTGTAGGQDGFEEVLADPEPPKRTRRLILCSGKVYYDLVEHRRQNKIKDAAILRVEQLYPFHAEKLAKLAERHRGWDALVWCQEESQNMGAWSFIAPQLEELFGVKPRYAGRDASASTAVGALAIHKLEQKALIEAAFTL